MKKIGEFIPQALRTWNNYDTNAASDETGLACPEPTLAQQQFKEDSDINTIVKRFKITGELPTNVRMPTYQDFEGVFDFQSAMNAVAQAGEAFDEMPAEIRTRFHNDPAEFVDFCSKEDNRAEAIKMGLVMPKVDELTGKKGNTGEPVKTEPQAVSVSTVENK